MIASLESDVFAVSMLLVIFCGMGVVGLLLLTMRWRASRRDSQVDELLEELAAEEKKQAAVGAVEEKRKPWEKEADWWKGDDDSQK
jgi:hypothetical protein